MKIEPDFCFLQSYGSQRSWLVEFQRPWLNMGKEAPMLSSTEATYEMSALIRNAHPDARVIVAETPVNPEGKYSKLYLLGNSGPVKRNKLHLDKSGASQKGDIKD